MPPKMDKKKPNKGKHNVLNHSNVEVSSKRGRDSAATATATIVTTNLLKPSLTTAASKKLKNPPCAGGNDTEELLDCFQVTVDAVKKMEDGLRRDEPGDVNRLLQGQDVYLGEKMVRFKCLSKFFLHTEDGKRFLDFSIPFPDDDSLQASRFEEKFPREVFLAFQLTALLKLLCPRCRMKDHPINGIALGFYMRFLVKYANFDANSIYHRQLNSEVCPEYLAKFRERVQAAEDLFRDKYALAGAEAAECGCHRVTGLCVSLPVQRTEATAECGCDHLDLYMYLSYIAIRSRRHVHVCKPSTDNPLFQLRFFTASEPLDNRRVDSDLRVHQRRAAFEALFNILQPTLVTLDGEFKDINTHSYRWVNSTRIELVTAAINNCNSHDDVLELSSVKDDGSQAVNCERLAMPEVMKGNLRSHQEESLAFMMNRETRGSQEFVEVRFDTFTEVAKKSPNKEYPLLAFYNPITTDMFFVCGDDPKTIDVRGVPLVGAPLAGSSYLPMLNDEIRQHMNPVIRGGILADAAGFGKVVELISLIASNPSQHLNKAPICPTWCTRFSKKALARGATHPSAETVADINTFIHIKATLIVAKGTICHQWVQELARYWPSAKVILYHGSDRSRFTLDDFAQADVIVSSCETLCAQMRAEPTKESLEILRNMDLSPAKRKCLHDHLQARASFILEPHGDEYDMKYREVLPNRSRTAVDALLGLLMNDETVPVFLRGLHFHRVVLDECQITAAGQKMLEAIQTDNMWVVTATPITSKGYGSLYPIMNKFLGCRSFSSTFFESMQKPTTKSFLDHWDKKYGQGLTIERGITAFITVNPNNKYSRGTLASGIHNVDPTNPNVYGQRWIVPFVLSQFMIRHIKTEKVLNDLDLPPLQHRNVMVSMNDLETHLYTKLFERIRKDFEHLSVSGRVDSRIAQVMVWVDQLRRAAVSPLLLLTETESATQSNIVKVTAPPLIEELENTPAAQKVSQTTIQLLKNMLEIPPEIDTCPVCMDTMAKPTMLGCHHFLCRECLVDVVERSTKPKCPVCHKSISSDPTNPNKEVSLAASHGNQEALVADLMEGTAPSWRSFLEQLSGNSSKINKLLELTTSIHIEDPSAKFVIFSHFPAFLKMALEALNEAGIKTAFIFGDTTLKERGRIIADFQRGTIDAGNAELPLKRIKKTRTKASAHDDGSGVKAIIISLRAGNAGVTLTAANHLILCEGSLNFAVEVQAISHIHRLGQTRPVTVHKLVTENTIEANILDDCCKNLLVGMDATDVATPDAEGAKKVAQLRRFLSK